ncbi:MAG: HAMP domain-containing protein [Nitrospira sp.]|nr:MAG: HAMP domain-containing protein [Nitrospira sp.]
MPIATEAMPSSQEYRKAFFLHSVQKGYAAWIGLLLFLYAALFFTLAFYGPHLGPMATLYRGGSLEERQAAASEMLLLSETVSVAVPVLFLGAVIFSLVLTRRVAGPLIQLDQSLQEWAKGNLSRRVEFRPSDRLDELASTANQALAKIEQAFGDMHRQTAALQAVLASNQLEHPESVQKAQQAAASLEKILGEFSFTRVR